MSRPDARRRTTVEEVRGTQLEARLSVARLADAVHHVDVFSPQLGEHLGNELGRILQIGVDHTHVFTERRVEPGGHGGLVAEVAREMDHVRPGMRGRDRVHQLGRRVARAVVDEDHVQVDRFTVQLLAYGAEPPDELVEARGFVVHGDNDVEPSGNLVCSVVGLHDPLPWSRPAKGQILPEYAERRYGTPNPAHPELSASDDAEIDEFVTAARPVEHDRLACARRRPGSAASGAGSARRPRWRSSTRVCRPRRRGSARCARPFPPPGPKPPRRCTERHCGARHRVRPRAPIVRRRATRSDAPRATRLRDAPAPRRLARRPCSR